MKKATRFIVPALFTLLFAIACNTSQTSDPDGDTTDTSTDVTSMTDTTMDTTATDSVIDTSANEQ